MGYTSQHTMRPRRSWRFLVVQTATPVLRRCRKWKASSFRGLHVGLGGASLVGDSSLAAITRGSTSRQDWWSHAWRGSEKWASRKSWYRRQTPGTVSYAIEAPHQERGSSGSIAQRRWHRQRPRSDLSLHPGDGKIRVTGLHAGLVGPELTLVFK